jgi:ribosomal protein S18 acetylase RimI-like enzyme
MEQAAALGAASLSQWLWYNQFMQQIMPGDCEHCEERFELLLTQDNRMTQLIKMNEAEFEAFMEISVAAHIQDQIAAGSWHPEEAAAKMKMMRDKILPGGFATPDQYFFKIANRNQEVVGGLWYMKIEQDGQPLAFVVDIQVYEPYRRLGYGTQAFKIMEEKVSKMGIQMIALNVFEHNQPAKAMYQKLGYVGEGESMVKEIRKSA